MARSTLSAAKRLGYRNVAELLAILVSGKNVDDTDFTLPVDIGGANVTVEASDLQIGAVELKDAASDQRASVDASGHLLTLSTPADPAATHTQTYDVTVDATAGGVTILASNSNRKGAVIQNVGAANMRVTVDGSAPTATHGIQMAPGDLLELSIPFIPKGDIKAIREGGTSTSASVLGVA